MAPSMPIGLRISLVSIVCGLLLCIGCKNLQPASNQTGNTALRKIYDEDQQNQDQDARRLLQDQVRHLYAHVLATTALGKGFAPAKWLSAATLDRYLQSLKQPQVFGTQFGGPVDDADMDSYNKYLLTDKIRELWCVASLSKQLKIAADIKAGREFTSTRTCPIPD